MFRFLVWLTFACLFLNVAGFFLDHAWARGSWQRHTGYFEMVIRGLGDFPFWLLATLLLVLSNGVALIRLARIRAYFFRRDGSAGGEIPLPPMQLLGVNLIVVPLLLLVFVVLALTP